MKISRLLLYAIMCFFSKATFCMQATPQPSDSSTTPSTGTIKRKRTNDGRDISTVEAEKRQRHAPENEKKQVTKELGKTAKARIFDNKYLREIIEGTASQRWAVKKNLPQTLYNRTLLGQLWSIPEGKESE